MTSDERAGLSGEPFTALMPAGSDIALVTGRVVALETFDEVTGTVTDRIVSTSPHVTDVCALLS